MAPSAFLQSFLQGTAPKNLRVIAAQGLAPIPPSEMIRLLVHLSADPEPGIASQAAATLGGWTEAETLTELRTRDCSAEVLEHFAGTSSSAAVQEAIILNPASTGEVVGALAARVPPQLMETILYNRARLLESPEIITGIKRNPSITKQIQVLVQEIESEFFTSKKTEYVVETLQEAASAAQETLAIEEALSPEEFFLEGLPTDPEEREAALFKRIGSMTVPQKLRLALIGTREARSILIRDVNRDVARNVLQSPKLTDAEVESFAAMRNVSDEVLRQIGVSREFTKSYGVVHNLAKNPRTPAFISQHLLGRLHNKDLALIARDRGVPELVRRNAQRTLGTRTATPKKGH
jgi:hypothetical protein